MDKIINSLTQILEGVLQADQQMMEKTKAKVFSALITVLQMKEMKGEILYVQTSRAVLPWLNARLTLCFQHENVYDVSCSTRCRI